MYSTPMPRSEKNKKYYALGYKILNPKRAFFPGDFDFGHRIRNVGQCVTEEQPEVLAAKASVMVGGDDTKHTEIYRTILTHVRPSFIIHLANKGKDNGYLHTL